ncbi:TVP38/TMEM64 family protein [Clostridium neuense]|uniref:TVP38/TMEM64 family membrane protein n=1 Tax=Clostridium neuense TaxID=1728934 RepID=A0ABW8TAW6_9CLOT
MNSKAKKILMYVCLIIFIMLAIILAFKFNRYHLGRVWHKVNGLRILHIRTKDIKRYILSYGEFAAVVFVIIYSLKPILFVVPASLLSIMAGGIFGPWKAFLLSMISCFFSATFAFFLAKQLGKPFVDKILKGKVMKLHGEIEKHGFIIMLLMRLSFIFAYDPLSYAAGLTSMKYKDFILGTVIGIMPEMICYSFMGKNFEKGFSLRSFFPLIIILIIAPTAAVIYKRYKSKSNT